MKPTSIWKQNLPANNSVNSFDQNVFNELLTDISRNRKDIDTFEKLIEPLGYNVKTTIQVEKNNTPKLFFSPHLTPTTVTTLTTKSETIFDDILNSVPKQNTDSEVKFSVVDCPKCSFSNAGNMFVGKIVKCSNCKNRFTIKKLTQAIFRCNYCKTTGSAHFESQPPGQFFCRQCKEIIRFKYNSKCHIFENV